MAKTISQQLASFIAGLRPDRLPADVIEMAKLCVLDWLASAISGRTTRPIQMFLNVARGLGGTPQATMIADGSKTSCHLAALVNAASSHVVEMDDLHKPSVLHPAAPVIPAALAVAERDGIAGPEFLTAIVAGYEVAIRAGEALGPSHYHFWQTTATCGVFGAATAAGRLLRLTPEQLVWALGSAGTQSAGLWEFLVEGAMSKQLHLGKASADGLLAALLAEQGLTAASQIFEGEKGLAQATSAAPKLARLTEGLGTRPLRILENSFKAHAACYHIHSSIDAALALKTRLNAKPTEITKIAVRVYSAALDLLEKVEPASPYAAKFSIPYCVATALLHGRVGLDDFTQEGIRDRAVRQLMSTVVLHRDPELDRVYPDKWPAVVTIETTQGIRHEARVDFPKGDPKNPMTPDELIAKFHALTCRTLPEPSRSLLIERCLTLDKLGNVRLLFERIEFAPTLDR
ncbi:MAG: MmgE/PrpD family protein [candidate division NC10 bacterium]|nr:MmgE/PrpD family protein [candidate division NC10 bacterium]